VLAQVRFAPILTIDKVVPEIQGALREEFPRFKRVVGRQLVLGPSPEVIPIEQWVFADRERETAVVLSRDFVVLETSRYDIYATFSASLRKAVEIVREFARPQLVERLGLRYVDLIRPYESEDKPQHEMRDYLRPGLHGPDLRDLGIEKGAYRFESRNITGLGNTIVVKLSHHADGAFLPNDMDRQHLRFDVCLRPGEEVALLDIDHFNEEPRDYDVDAVMEQMEALHTSIKETFVRCVTPKALDLWDRQGDWSLPNEAH
jgi:uncharacterized protein (TIGR04255 family)